jgi:hypothetical protein
MNVLKHPKRTGVVQALPLAFTNSKHAGFNQYPFY